MLDKSEQIIYIWMEKGLY